MAPTTRSVDDKLSKGTRVLTAFDSIVGALYRATVALVQRVPPSPSPVSPGRSRNMAAIGRRDTGPERQVRSLLHAAGLRFRVDFPITVNGARPIRPDIVFTRRRVAVFIDGCFWHGCPEHGKRPTIRNDHYWAPKIAGNTARDRRHTAALEAVGWTVLRFWEHTSADAVSERIRVAVTRPGAGAARDAESSG